MRPAKKQVISVALLSTTEQISPAAASPKTLTRALGLIGGGKIAACQSMSQKKKKSQLSENRRVSRQRREKNIYDRDIKKDARE